MSNYDSSDQRYFYVNEGMFQGAVVRLVTPMNWDSPLEDNLTVEIGVSEKDYYASISEMSMVTINKTYMTCMSSARNDEWYKVWQKGRFSKEYKKYLQQRP